MSDRTTEDRRPSPFLWGVASSAYQIEGGTDRDGRGPSIWDTFCARAPRKVRYGSGQITSDHYARMESDVDLIAQLGVNAYRFSIAWPRVIPDGTGAINDAGLDFYDRLVDRLLARGIAPFVTLYHWDLPEALERRGGFVNREIAEWLAYYASVCVKRLGDRVKRWTVLNEGLTFTGAGYLLAIHAPGRRWPRNFLPAAHHALLAQGRAARAIKALDGSALVGTAVALTRAYPYRPIDADRAAVDRLHALQRMFLDPVLGRAYPLEQLPFLRPIEKHVQAADMETIRFPADFIGVNHYFSTCVAASSLVPWVRLRPVPQKGREHTAIGWDVDPAAFRELLCELSRDPQMPRLIVTENGACYRDVLPAAGALTDPERTSYLRRYTGALLEAKASDARVDGYFAWSLFDGFEWNGGHHDAFGLYHVDPRTQDRTLKDSGRWYRGFVRSRIEMERAGAEAPRLRLVS